MESAFQHYAGTNSYNYFEFPKNVDGTIVGTEDKYKTTAIVDDAIAWIQNQKDETPWFVWMGFYNPHLPYHLPPRDLHGFDDLEDRLFDRNNPEATDELPPRALERVPEVRPYFSAMLQALDTEIGRLISHIDKNVSRETYIIFLSDNGTAGEVAMSERPYYRFKGTVYEGGVRVPLVIRGPGIENPGRRVNGLVNVTDLFATIMELAGGQEPLKNMRRPLDSKSLTPYFNDDGVVSSRPWIFAEKGAETDPYSHAVRDQRYKLIIENKSLRLFDLELDPHEEKNLMRRSMSKTERTAARDLFAAFRELHETEEKPFTNVDPEEFATQYDWIACNASDQACLNEPG